MATTAADPRGLKRICPSCGTRYYDFNKRPVICPSCKAEFAAESKAKGRTRRSPANDEALAKKAVPAAAPAEEEDVEIADEDLVSLDEVEEMEEGDDDDDLEIDDEIEDLDDLEEDDADDDEEEEEEEDEE